MKTLLRLLPAYKQKCKEWGNMRILDFLAGTTFHDIKNIYTKILIQSSKFRATNDLVDCDKIFDVFIKASPIALLLLDAEAGGGKTTTFRRSFKVFGEGGADMSIDDFTLIIPLV